MLKALGTSTVSAGRAAVVVVSMILAGCGGGKETPDTAATTPAHSPDADVIEWRAKHERDYRRDWVSIAGLHLLRPGVNTAGSDPSNDFVIPGTPAHVGRFVLTGDTVRFEPDAGAAVHQKEAVIRKPMTLRDDSQSPPDELQVDDVRLVIHKSGPRLALRVRNPNGPLAKDFQGFTWFPIDPAYKVTGHFVPDATPQKARVVNTYGDVDDYPTEGVIEFTLLGQSLKLRPFTTRPKRFYIVFKDASSGEETYGVARFLYADLQDDGTAVLDFNMAYNPPCSFNPYTTCPIPLKENTLPVKVLAGEKAYTGHLAEIAK